MSKDFDRSFDGKHNHSDDYVRLRKAYCAAYAYFLRSRQSSGASIRGIQVLAARAAGVGQVRGSWSERSAYQTQRSMACRMMKEDIVKAELESLDLVFDEFRKEWYDPKIQRTR